MAFSSTSITVHPEIQDGTPVFSGTRIPIETFADYLRIGVKVDEFLDEFPSISRDQANEVYDLLQNDQQRFSAMPSYTEQQWRG
jgi:uncharacterized protein (DUF433 family)